MTSILLARVERLKAAMKTGMPERTLVYLMAEVTEAMAEDQMDIASKLTTLSESIKEKLEEIERVVKAMK